jgi:hypothetical protein
VQMLGLAPSERKVIRDEVSTEEPRSVKQFMCTPFTTRIKPSKFCNRL